MSTPSIHRRLSKLAIPNIASNLLVPLASAIDLALLGHLADVRDLAGVALGAVIFDYVFWTFGFLRMATTGLTAQARGRMDVSAERLVALRGLLIGVGAGLLILLLQVPLRELGFTLLRGDEDLESAAAAYYNARIWGAPFTLSNYVLLGWFLGREQSTRALWMSAVGHGSNIVLDIVFIAGLGWGAMGAGAATAISQVAMFVCAIALGRRHFGGDVVRALGARILDRSELRSFFSLSRDITIRTLLLISTFAVFTNVAATMGVAVLAATAVLRQIVTIAAWFVDGIAFAVESLAGVFAGAGDMSSMRITMRLSMLWAVGISAVLAAACGLAPATVLGIFTDHTSVVREATRHVWWLAPVLLLGAPAYIYDGLFLGLTSGTRLRNAMIFSALVGFAPIAVWANAQQNVHLLWLALATFMLARTVSLGLLAPRAMAEGLAHGRER